MNCFTNHRKEWFYLVFWLFVFSNVGESKSVVNTLPGFLPGTTLPFKLETGYVTVGKKEDIELFYYFIESERDPETDPLILWHTGGPGCSAFSGLVYEIGPLRFDFEVYDKDGSTKLLLNPYSWTKRASIIFLDSPVGTGFSYGTTQKSCISSDTKAAEDICTFIRKWLSENPKFKKNRFYIGGDSYAGKIVPMVSFEIVQGIEAGLNPEMNLQGYIIGNPFTDKRIDGNAQIPYAHGFAILSDQYYKMLKVNCQGEYTYPDPSNAQCQSALQLFNMCTKDIFPNHVLEPKCPTVSSKTDDLGLESGNATSRDDDSLIRLFSRPPPRLCRDDNCHLSEIWANEVAVREALHVRNGTIKEWKRCDRNLPHYGYNMDSVFHYHKLLTNKGIEALVYSGDHDMLIPYIGTREWIRLLNLTVVDDWRPWLDDDQVAGYTERYFHKETKFHLTFATVKGAGHTAPEYKPKECFAMLERFLESDPL